MKIIYQRPPIEVIQVKQEYNLLAGSPDVKTNISVEDLKRMKKKNFGWTKSFHPIK